MDNRSTRHRAILDRLAIILSALCLVHCLLLPALILAMPLLAQLDETHFHAQMLIVVVPVSLFAFALGYRRHANRVIIAWGIVGIAIMFIGGTIVHEKYGLLPDTLLTITGSLILATSHFFNSRLTRHVPAG